MSSARADHARTRSEGRATTVRSALSTALRDLYHHSLPLFVMNSALSLFTSVVVLLGLLFPIAFFLLLALGPLLAALMHCSVMLVHAREVRLADARMGLRLHWQRGLGLFASVVGVAVLVVISVLFYGQMEGVGRVLAVVAIYLALFFGVYQLALWPLAIDERDRPLTTVMRAALLAVFRRPLGFFTIATALFLLNLAGAAAALAPLLTVTIAYSFLAAAHYTLSQPDQVDIGRPGDARCPRQH